MIYFAPVARRRPVRRRGTHQPGVPGAPPATPRRAPAPRPGPDRRPDRRRLRPAGVRPRGDLARGPRRRRQPGARSASVGTCRPADSSTGGRTGSGPATTPTGGSGSTKRPRSSTASGSTTGSWTRRIESFKRRQDAAIGGDPIGAVVDATEGGPFAVMMIAHAAARAAGLTLEELREAVLERARAEAEDLDDIAAESLLARVHQAIWDAPEARLNHDPRRPRGTPCPRRRLQTKTLRRPQLQAHDPAGRRGPAPRPGADGRARRASPVLDLVLEGGALTVRAKLNGKNYPQAAQAGRRARGRPTWRSRCRGCCARRPGRASRSCWRGPDSRPASRRPGRPRRRLIRRRHDPRDAVRPARITSSSGRSLIPT